MALGVGFFCPSLFFLRFFFFQGNVLRTQWPGVSESSSWQGEGQRRALDVGSESLLPKGGTNSPLPAKVTKDTSSLYVV